MPSNQRVRSFEPYVGYAVVFLVCIGVALGYLFEDWSVLETWVPVAVVAFLVYLFYRLVVAVEHLAYDA